MEVQLRSKYRSDRSFSTLSNLSSKFKGNRKKIRLLRVPMKFKCPLSPVPLPIYIGQSEIFPGVCVCLCVCVGGGPGLTDKF